MSPLFSLLWFRCLSLFFSLLSFLRKGVLFHHDLLVLPGSGLGFGACLPSSLFFGSGACLPSSLFFGSGACLPSSLFFLSSGKGFCSIMICWFLLVSAGVPVLVSLLLSSFLRKGVLFHHDLLVPLGSGWGSGACLPSSLFFGSTACLPSSLFFLSSGKGFCSIMICCFFLVPASVLVSLILSSLLRCLSPFFSLLSFLRTGVLFHHDLLVPLGPGWGSGACLPSSLFFVSGACLPSSLFFLSSGKGFCSMIRWFLGFRCLSPLFSLLWFRCLSPFFSLLSFLRNGVLFHHDLLVPLGSGWGSGACLPSSLFFGSGACLPSSLFFLSSGKGFCSIMIWWFLLVPAGVLVLVSLLLSSLFPVLVFLLLSSWFCSIMI